jgi:hypothetical protein
VKDEKPPDEKPPDVVSVAKGFLLQNPEEGTDFACDLIRRLLTALEDADSRFGRILRLTEHSTREIVFDNIGELPSKLGPRRLGHNPSWLKSADVLRIVGKKDT